MVNKPLKLQDNLSLYSGDVITINNSNPLLIEIMEDQTIKLRNIKDNNYLSEKKNKSVTNPLSKSRSFSTDFENALIFIVKQNNDGKISLQRKDKKDKYLELNDKKFYLSPEEKWLTITKQKNTENIANFEETKEIIKLHKKEEKINDEELLVIACKSYDNKTDNSLEYTFEFAESIQKEHNFTLSTDFTLGASVKLSCSQIVGAEIGGQFEKKTGTSDSITKTEVKDIKESLKVNCSPWKKTRVKLEVKKSRLLTPYTANVKRVIGGKIYEYSINGKYSYDNYSESRCLTEETTVRNILIVGWTGSGKSTLANVLSKSNDFKESNQSTPGTKWGKKSNEFEFKGNNYCVIDNIGFGDTKISEREELIRIGEAINSAYQGLSQVLFVFAGRFSDQEKEGFRKLAALKITNSYITIVRSKFDNFGNKSKCNEDKELLEKESLEIGQMLNNCRGFLHIDNGDGDSRDDSREIILSHLHNSCKDNPFKPKEWEDITSLIEDYFKEKGKLENEIKENIGQKEAVEQQIDKLKADTADQIKEKAKGKEISEFIGVIEVVNKK